MNSNWVFSNVDQRRIGQLREKTNLSNFLSKLLIIRGFEQAEDAVKFLEARLVSLPLPDSMLSFRQGIEIVSEFIERRRRIFVYGDYDVDGICSAAIITDCLQRLGADVVTGLANRFDYGYGLGEENAKDIISSGASCAIIVDCGTSDHEQIALLESHGVKTVVIDHHIPSSPPPASSFINPLQKGCNFPDKNLAASGLCFYFATVLLGKKEKRKEIYDPRNYLDLAAIGTVADITPLTGANRCIVKNGGKLLNNPRRPAIKKILMGMGIADGKWDRGEELISFVISPVLNSAGRMSSPQLALNFLLSRNEKEAEILFRRIAYYNEKRKEEEKNATSGALFKATRKIGEGNKNSAGLVLFDKGWHVGVLGIVASKLMAKYTRPVCIIGIDGNCARGSIRAPEGIDIFSPLSPFKSLFERFGGHSSAIGFTIKKEKIPEFEEVFEHISASCLKQFPPIVIDETFNVSEIESSHVDDCQKLAPYGMGNPEPLVCLKNFKVESVRMTQNGHLQGVISSSSKQITVFGRNMAENVKMFYGARELVGNLRYDTYRGCGAIQVILKDFR